MRPILLCLSLLGWLAGFTQNSPTSAPISDLSTKTDLVINAWMKDHKTPGLALAVIANGRISKLSAYGVSNFETHTTLTTTGAFMTASLSKQFIATAILLLEQDGKLSLDDKISLRIDSLPAAWAGITIRHLLTHTSGLVRDPKDYHPYTEQPPMEVIRSMYTTELGSAPGEKFLYSNVGYYLLAEITTRVSGVTWDSFIRERIFRPAGLVHTRTANAKEIVADRVSGYHIEKGMMQNAENWIAVRPSGAFLSTIEDMAAWELYSQKQFSASSTLGKSLLTPAVLNSGAVAPYALGWYVESYLNNPRIHHDGQFPGFRADYERFTDADITVIILSNLDNNGLESLALQVAGVYKESIAPPTFRVTANTPSDPVTPGAEVPITIQVTSLDKASPSTVIEMEIWDAEGKAVYKRNLQNITIGAKETKALNFSWKPEKPGTYTINAGVYGPRWVLSFSWNMKLATVIVKP